MLFIPHIYPEEKKYNLSDMHAINEWTALIKN